MEAGALTFGARVRRTLTILLIACHVAPTIGRAADCTADLARAESDYRSGRFDEAILLLDACLRQPGLTQAERAAACRLEALTYLALDDTAKMRDAVHCLLESNRAYVPDPNADPPPFTALVDEVRREMPPALPEVEAAAPPAVAAPEKSHRTRTWIVLVAAGLALIGGIVKAASPSGGHGGGDDSVIVPPPALPDHGGR